MQQLENLTGYIMVPTKGTEFAHGAFAHCKTLKDVGPIADSVWEQYEYSSTIPLVPEHQLQKGPYVYPVICRVASDGALLLLMSSHKRIIDTFLASDESELLQPGIYHIGVSVDAVVRNLTRSPGVYTLSFVHARLPGFGSALRAVSFYGDNVAEASMFRENLGKMNCFTCGLRALIEAVEIARIGTDGLISFHLPGELETRRERLRDVEGVMKYLRRGGYLSETK